MASITSNKNDFLPLLHSLIQNWENEVVEFKEASNDYDQDRIGRYFSALSNEARLKGLAHAWLAFGVNNRTREIVGTDYRDTQGLQTLKHEIACNTTDRITFIDIFEVYNGDKRVVMFKIPASVIGTPTAWKGHWYGREGESLAALSVDELDRLRGQMRIDWSSQLIEDSSIDYLDANAIQIARRNYKEKHDSEHISTEVDNMNNEEFLTKIGLIVNGRLTNAAMVLLGNPDYDNRLAVPIRTMWRLYGADGLVKDYFEFRIPYITVVDRVYEKVRNLTYRYIPNRHSLNTYELPKYDVAMQRELLFNSIAHMDYTQGGRIYVDEYDDYFVVQNPGSFLPGDILTVLQPLYSAPYYRNSLLAQTMTSFNMIDTVAMGIRKVFQIQQKRLFPMPDYLFMKPDKVAVKVYGDILDENYMRILYDHPELDVETVYLLDCVQKRQKLTTDQYKILRKLRVIEGKAPNIFVSSMIAEIIDERGQYIRNKAMDEKYYMDLIISYLQQWGKGERSDFVKLIGDKLPDTLNEKQKTSKVKNILTAMRSKGIIEYSNENKRTGVWVLAKKTKDTTG